MLFAVLALQDPRVASMFADVVERGPGVLAELGSAARAELAGQIAGAFRAAFLAIACFSAGAVLLAWSLPVRRI